MKPLTFLFVLLIIGIVVTFGATMLWDLVVAGWDTLTGAVDATLEMS